MRSGVVLGRVTVEQHIEGLGLRAESSCKSEVAREQQVQSLIIVAQFGQLCLNRVMLFYYFGNITAVAICITDDLGIAEQDQCELS